MATHSRAFFHVAANGMDRNPTGEVSLSPTSRVSMSRTLQHAPLSTWRDKPNLSTTDHLPAVNVAASSIVKALRDSDMGQKNFFVEAFQDGEASDVFLMGPYALDSDSFAMLDKLNELGGTLGHASAIREQGPEAELSPAAPSLGHLRLDYKTCAAFWKGRSVNLTITEFNIVSLFARRIGENLTYREIYDVVHGEGFCAGDGANGYQINVRSLIKRIRQKFHAVDESFAAIENHRGFGYRWRAPDTPAPGDDAGDRIEDRASARPLVLMVLLASQTAG